MKTPKVPLAVHLLMDNSGSMRYYHAEAVKASNTYLAHLATSLTPAVVSLSTFNSFVKDIVKTAPVYDLPRITMEQYKICGGTAINRAALHGIEALDMVDAEAKVLVVMTDGETGDIFDADKVKTRLADRIGKGWLAIYLDISDAGTKRQCKDMGIPTGAYVHLSPAKLEKALAMAAALTLDFHTLGVTEFTAEQRKLFGL